MSKQGHNWTKMFLDNDRVICMFCFGKWMVHVYINTTAPSKLTFSQTDNIITDQSGQTNNCQGNETNWTHD